MFGCELLDPIRPTELIVHGSSEEVAFALAPVGPFPPCAKMAPDGSGLVLSQGGGAARVPEALLPIVNPPEELNEIRRALFHTRPHMPLVGTREQRGVRLLWHQDRPKGNRAQRLAAAAVREVAARASEGIIEVG